MKTVSLRSRIRNGALLMLAIALVFGAFTVTSVHHLGGAIRATLMRNYISIEAGQHMHEALYRAQIALAKGAAAANLDEERELFTHWIKVELGDITENGEGPLARQIEQRGALLFAAIARGQRPSDAEFAELHDLIDRLIDLNQTAMFKADSRSMQLSNGLAYEYAGGLALLLLVGIVLSWTRARALAAPLAEFAEHLRSFSLRGPSVRVGPQPLSELQAVASEFNRMAERLEEFEKLNVDRLIYEKGKTEAIIESLEDGVVLIDPSGIVTHINEVAGIILGIGRAEALGSAFDDLDSNSPHYLRVRSALHGLGGAGPEAERVEVDLHVRGRDHTYLLKPVPLRQDDGRFFGTILILQDITYLRDRDRARTNLVATLSHELKTPLTSLGLSAELLMRRGQWDDETRELLKSIQEDIARMRRLAANLLDLASGQGPAIAVQYVPTDLIQLLHGVTRGFALQAEQKNVELVEQYAVTALELAADPVKLSWVITNLIANALRYTPAGGRIVVTAGPTDDGARIEVRDTGPGIPPEIRERLFERYAQWNVNGAEPGSAGLGLAIAKEIVDAHGGRIFVASEPGQGTAFTVELPRAALELVDGKTVNRR
ncbi:MAG TPA: ATP-binding protein [Candidatus Binataceae bacterium]|nr:ATP-binding protein [Candidatus Binataceae bacterium]